MNGQTLEHALLAFTVGVKQMICCCNKVFIFDYFIIHLYKY
ncbi:putative protein-synthesizing GTPase [Medicago truncatula]|uniref:Uncharacterized protein n=1 Tax=Medicago truncatula TaxID=3880 RepID=A0A396GKJ6_MEDTR|nr:putative protein-synthesizing GTPase [Medicago truncatula]